MAGPAPQYYTYKNSPGLQGQQLGFSAGKGYYARGALPQAAASDPYSQLTGYQPLTAPQIQTQAQGEISPLIKAITGQATAQAGQAAAQIKGLSDEYASELGQINMAAPYQQSEGQQAAVDAALQQSLTGEGSSLAGGLSDRLAQLQGTSGAPALQQAAGQLASQGQSNGTTALANGSAALSSLIANAAAGAGFGEKLPGIAKLSGIQALGQNSAAQQKAVNDATLQAESQLPSIIQNLTANNDARLSNAVSARQKNQALAIDQAVKDATLGQGAQKIKIAGQNANTAAQRAADTAAYQQVEAQLRQEGITATNTRAANALKAKEKPKPPSGATLRNLGKDLTTWTTTTAPKQHYDTSAKAWVPVPGTGSQPLPYAQVVQNLITSYGLSQSDAEARANTKYQPGQYGRPYPVAPPAGTHPLAPNRVIDGRGGIYKLVAGKWIPQTSRKADFKPVTGGG